MSKTANLYYSRFFSEVNHSSYIGQTEGSYYCIAGPLGSKLCNQVRSLDHFVVQNSGDYIALAWIVGWTNLDEEPWYYLSWCVSNSKLLQTQVFWQTFRCDTHDMKSTLDEWSTYDDDNFWQILSRSGHSSSHRNYLSRKLAPKKMGSKLFLKSHLKRYFIWNFCFFSIKSRYYCLAKLDFKNLSLTFDN